MRLLVLMGGGGGLFEKIGFEGGLEIVFEILLKLVWGFKVAFEEALTAYLLRNANLLLVVLWQFGGGSLMVGLRIMLELGLGGISLIGAVRIMLELGGL